MTEEGNGKETIVILLRVFSHTVGMGSAIQIILPYGWHPMDQMTRMIFPAGSSAGATFGCGVGKKRNCRLVEMEDLFW